MASPLTTPLLETVATLVFEDVHGVVASGVADPVSVLVSPRQTLGVPVIVGNGLTKKLAVCVQPFVFLYVIVTVPALTPVTTPVLETVATAVFEEVQGLVACAVPLPVSVEVLPTQATNVPLIVGSGFTVNVVVWVQLFVLR